MLLWQQITWALSYGPVNPLVYLITPGECLAVEIREIDELACNPEILLHVLDRSLHLTLDLGSAYSAKLGC